MHARKGIDHYLDGFVSFLQLTDGTVLYCLYLFAFALSPWSDLGMGQWSLVPFRTHAMQGNTGEITFAL